MDSDDGGRLARRPSLYTAIRLARLVQQFRERLEAKVRSRGQRDALVKARSSDLAQFKSQANAQTQLGERNCLEETPIIQYRDVNYGESNWSSSLRRVDDNLSHASEIDPLDTAARDDERLLEFDAVRLVSSKHVQKASNVLDNTTLMLERITALQEDEVMRQQVIAGYGFNDGIDFEKYLANLEHMLRCLQQAAFQALVQHSLEALQTDYSHWSKYLEQVQRSCADWYSEWSSGRPPLNSRMPWNIKPSLVVLWGVCWMFYMPNAPTSDAEQPGEESWLAQPYPQPTMANPGHGNASLVRMSHTTGRSPPGLSTRLGNNVGPDSSVSDMIGSLNTSAFASPGAEMTHISPSSSHMTTGFYGAQASHQAHTQYLVEREGLFQKFTPSTGIRTPVTSIPTSISDASFATHSSIWSPTLNPNQNQGQSFVTHNAAVWQQPSLGPSDEDISPRPVYHHHSDLAVNPYAEHLDQISTAAPFPNLYASGQYGFPARIDHTLNPNFRYLMTNQSYPSPRSDVSNRESSLCPVTMPEQTSPQIPVTNSPSVGHSSSSRRGSPSQTGEPPRNDFNQLYCEHPECAANPPAFSRKCQWTKHMDKHLRPYVCREPGCEKIRGFTYSGGLLRHEREVHRQHGGPRAPRFCPHQDCKRSTGQGFSRKENLNEHLRRVHRGVGIVESKDEAPSPQPAPAMLPSQRLQDPPRKRRREEVEQSDQEIKRQELMPGASGAELRDEIMRLRQELAVKEESIQRMRAVLQMPSASGLR